MQKVRKGLQQKLNLINKIQNNLRIKKVELTKPFQKMSIDLPLIDINSGNGSRGQNYQKEKINERLQQFKMNRSQKIDKKQYPFYSPQEVTKGSKQARIIFASSTSRFNSKYSPSKIAQFRTIMNDKNYSNEYLRKTFFEKSNTIFYTNNPNIPKKSNANKEVPFYGKMNAINHITGSKFKSLENMSNSLEPEYLLRKQFQARIRKRIQMRQDNNGQYQSLMFPHMDQNPQNIFHNQRQNSSNIHIHKSSQKRHKKNKSQLPAFNDRYSPWNIQDKQDELWEGNANPISIKPIK